MLYHVFAKLKVACTHRYSEHSCKRPSLVHNKVVAYGRWSLMRSFRHERADVLSICRNEIKCFTAVKSILRFNQYLASFVSSPKFLKETWEIWLILVKPKN